MMKSVDHQQQQHGHQHQQQHLTPVPCMVMDDLSPEISRPRSASGGVERIPPRRVQSENAGSSSRRGQSEGSGNDLNRVSPLEDPTVPSFYFQAPRGLESSASFNIGDRPKFGSPSLIRDITPGQKDIPLADYNIREDDNVQIRSNLREENVQTRPNYIKITKHGHAGKEFPVEQRSPDVDQLTAELKSKLGRYPILLPPKDYDTINRERGNLVGIEFRRCLNEDITGTTHLENIWNDT